MSAHLNTLLMMCLEELSDIHLKIIWTTISQNMWLQWWRHFMQIFMFLHCHSCMICNAIKINASQPSNAWLNPQTFPYQVKDNLNLTRKSLALFTVIFFGAFRSKVSVKKCPFCDKLEWIHESSKQLEVANKFTVFAGIHLRIQIWRRLCLTVK